MNNVKLTKRSDANDTLKVIFDFSYGGRPVSHSKSLVLFYQQCLKDQTVRLIFNVHFDYQWTSWAGHLYTSTLETLASCPMTPFPDFAKKQFPQLLPGASGSPPHP